MENHKPYIPAHRVLPEITVKAILLGLILSAVLSAANAYLGLFLGMTVSASIPAAVVSMALFKAFKNSNILENNAVQTAASAGESLAAGVIFTIPALVMMGYWSEFSYLETTLIALCGGILGVFFTIPLRSALIVKEALTFPEGIATAEVLKTGEEGGGQYIRKLVAGSFVGAAAKFVVEGLKLWPAEFQVASLVKNKIFLYFGTYLTPAVMAVGYIVGLNISFLVFLGGFISWYIAIPSYIAINGVTDADNLVDIGGEIWSTKIRFLGVGAMIIGGLWSLISIRKSLWSAISQGREIFSRSKKQTREFIRTEYDTPLSWVILGTAIMIIPIFIIYLREIHDVAISAFMAVLMVLAGFLFSSVAGYMAGLVGSSNNPISGVTIATILTSALILAALIGTDSQYGAAASIFIGAIVCCAAAIAGDNMQDLKSGYLLGATPQKQQLMQILGVVAAALVLSPILNLLHTSYVIGSKSLSAPQASLMMSVAEGIFGGELPWGIIWTGIGIGGVIILIDEYLRKKRSTFRMPVLAVAVGLYLPFSLDSAVFLGGIVSYFTSRFFKSRNIDKLHEERRNSEKSGLLFASGLITGEALVGILLAIPIALTANKDFFKIMEEPLPSYIGALALVGICYWLYSSVVSSFKSRERSNIE